MSDKPFSRAPLPRLVKGQVLLDEETRRRINRAHFRRTLTVFSIAAVIATLAGIYFSPILRVHDVKVEGAVHVKAEDIRETLDADGASMLTARFDASAARIKQDPLVQSVKIERDWPNSVRVIITERTAWGSWIVGDKVHAVDRDGVVLPIEAPAKGPVIRGLDADNTLATGEQVNFAAIKLAVQLLEHVPPRLKMGITAMEWSDIGGMAIATDAGYRVVIGDGDDLNYKLAVWAQIDSYVGRENMSGHVLDLRYGDRPSLQ